MIYPYLSLKTYFNSVEQSIHLNLHNSRYELKVFIHISESEVNEILTTDSNLKIRIFDSTISYLEDSSIRYLVPVGIGSCNVELQYNYDGNVLEQGYNFSIFVPGYYPRLKAKYYYSGSEQSKFLDIEKTKYQIKIFLDFSETESVELSISNSNLHINVLDNNCFFKIESGIGYIYCLSTGSCLLNIHYTYMGIELSLKDEILVYEPFLRENFARNGFSEFDYIIYQQNTKFRVLFKTLFEFVDILYAYNEDIKTVNDIHKIKTKFLTILGESMGFERKSAYDESKWYFAYTKLYRELLINLLDLLGIRGTRLSYELFFGALGYDIELLEYWFDSEGHLIEINKEDFENSTFFAYTEDGSPLEDIQSAHIDPRKDIGYENDYNKSNKSVYIRPILTLKSNIYHPATESTTYEKILIRDYLEWLKPNHIQYLLEVYRQNLTRYGTGEFDIGENLIDLDSETISVASLYELIGVYINESGVQTDLEALDYIPTNPGYPYWIKPPATSSSSETTLRGPWHTGSFGYQELGLTGKTLLSITGLANNTTYYFKVSRNRGTVTEYHFTTPTSGDITYDILIQLLNTLNSEFQFKIVSGDLRCQSNSVGYKSSIALSNGTTGTNLWTALTDFVSFDTAVDGDESIPYGDVRGMCIEHIKTFTDNMVIGGIVEMYDSIESPLPYDSIYEYDEAEPDSVGIHYDRGILLNENDLIRINTQNFKNSYDGYIQTHSLSATKIYLAGLYNITVDLVTIVLGALS